MSSFRRAWRRLSDEAGRELVEFAYVFLMLATLVLGIMEFSRFLYTYHFVSEAAREGTRYASVRGSTFKGVTCTVNPVTYACDAKTTTGNVIQTYVRGFTPPGISAGSVTATPSWPETTPDSGGAVSATCSTSGATTNPADSPGCYVQVKVSYPYTFLFSFLPGSSSTWTVSSTSEMVIAQ
jgi:Flp pilus assembly protein TadG